MTVSELKDEARKILEIPEVAGDCALTAFETRSGGLYGLDGLEEASRTTWDHCNTVRHGWTCKTKVEVMCRDTGAKDKDGRTIYATPTGRVFVFVRIAGSPEDLGRAWFVSPTLSPTFI